MYIANTHLKPVLGLDLHFVNTPIPFIPLPHPFIGLVIDPFDYIPFVGASVRVNNVPRGNTDTAGMLITFIHIPFGIAFSLMPIIGHDSSNFFGSKTVNVEGAPFSGAGYVMMTCSDIGIPLSLQPGRKLKPIPSFYLPTAFSIPLQWGKPVYVGGPMVPHFSLTDMLLGFAFGSVLKGLGKLGGALLKVLNKKLLRKFDCTQKLADRLCKMGFEPVDLISGRVNYEYCDFELPGPIPFCWNRNWDSDSRIKGPLGHGVSLAYDRYIRYWPEDGLLSMALADGRHIVFPMLSPGEHFYHNQEKVLLRRKQNGHFLLEDYNNTCYLHFNHDAEPDYWYLSFIENYSGHRVQLHYNGRRLRAITDSVGRVLSFELDKAFRITQITVQHQEMQQVLMRYGYNEEGDLVSIIDALGKEVSIEYHDHLMTRKTDRNGQNFYWEYDDKKRCVHTWGDGGILEGTIEYHNGYNTVTNSLGEVTTYYFDENNLCIQETDHYGNHRYTEFNDEGELYRTINEEGQITGFAYDDRNRLNTISLPDGNTIQCHFNDHNQLFLHVDAEGTATTFKYDDQRRLSCVKSKGNRLHRYKYNEAGHVAEIIDATDHATSFLYDDDANLTNISFSDGTGTSWKYDALGRCVQAVNATGQTRYIEYDALGRVVNLSLPDGNFVKLQYNAYYNVIHAKDRYSQVHFAYTPLGRMKERRQQNSAIQYLYDTEERLQTIINEKGAHFSFEYNKRGEIVAQTGFDGLTRRFERDASGKVFKALRPGGRFTAFEYDAIGRIIKMSWHDGTCKLFRYYKTGLLKEAINEHSTVRYTYDKQGNVQTEEADGYSIHNTYDKWDNRIRITSSLGADLAFSRDELGLVNNMRAAINPLEQVWDAAISYQAGYETQRKLPGELISEWRYDPNGKPVEHKVSRQGNIQSLKKYNWAANERLIGVFDALSQANTRFSYNEKGHLVFAQYADNRIVHRTADEAGNLYETKDQSDRKYNTAGAVLESKKCTYQYDEEGYLVSKTNKVTRKTTRYEWYACGNLKKVIRPDGKEVTFTYDALGRRVTKSYNGKITRWVWDGDVPLHEWSYDETQQPKQVVNEWGDMGFDKEEPNPVNAPGDTNGITWIFEPDNYVPCARMDTQSSYSIICDHLGTPQMAFDASGQKVWEGALDIYGRPAIIQGTNSFIPFRYQGQYEDEETGLYYNRYRYYSPEEGMYISQDPNGLTGGIQFYAYVGNPTIHVDIFGLNPVYYGPDDFGRPRGGWVELTKDNVGKKAKGTRPSHDPPGWKGPDHPHHHARGHLIAQDHGGKGGKKAYNLVTITDGTNNPGMENAEKLITKYVKDNETTVLLEVLAEYDTDADVIPNRIWMYAIDADGKVVYDDKIPNGLLQNHKKAGCC